MLFSLKEFIITKPKTIPLDIADKLYWYHILPMIPVRNTLGVWVSASSFSGYRPKWWELNRGRSGNSQHVFIDKGAVDWTCSNFYTNKNKLLNLIIEHTEYTRIAVYESFIHCDYKPTNDGNRQLFSSDSSSNWDSNRNNVNWK